MAEVERRRRRLRRPAQSTSGAPAPAAPPSAQAGTVHQAGTVQDTDRRGTGDNRAAGNGNGNPNGTSNGDGDERETERGLRGLVGSGASQVSLSAAMRARDAGRPDSADIAAAEHDLVIIRRGWVPREELPRNLR